MLRHKCKCMEGILTWAVIEVPEYDQNKLYQVLIDHLNLLNILILLLLLLLLLYCNVTYFLPIKTGEGSGDDDARRILSTRRREDKERSQ